MKEELIRLGEYYATPTQGDYESIPNEINGELTERICKSSELIFDIESVYSPCYKFVFSSYGYSEATQPNIEYVIFRTI